MRKTPLLPVLFVLLWGLAAPGALAASDDLSWARENFSAGRYADAAKNLEKVLAGAEEAEKTEARRFLARVYLTTGKYAEAEKLFAAVKEPAVDELNLVGESLLARGRHKEAGEAFQKAFEASKQQSVVARVNLIELWEATGQREMADLARKWFFDNYRKSGSIRYEREGKDVTDPQELVCLGRAMARIDPQGAINAFTRAEQENKRDVEPYVRSYFLFSEKFAWGEAEKELARSLQLNRRDPQVQLAAAEQALGRQDDMAAAERALGEALAVNPNFVAARALRAALHIFDDEYDEAKKELDAALAVNPNDLEALATLAAWHHDQNRTAEFEADCKKVLEINPQYAGLYNTVASVCERKRQFPAARALYQKATELAPDDWRGWYGAGMGLVRAGQDAEGKKLLEKAFALNKYNLFCRNMLVVLDKLVPPEGQPGQFESLKTEHFVIWAPKDDAPFLLPYYARFLEERYARLQERYGFTPEGPLVVEAFGAHADFSARTAGLPGIGADGACFGKLITLDDPRVWQAGSVPQFNWGVVAEHELTHVFSLQMTDFRIPRWLTEGMSVYEESAPRIDLDRLFVTALANNALIKVADMNRQMSRPAVPVNALLAYYQGGQIVGYIEGQYGAAGLKKLLAECRAGRKIDAAVKNSLGCSMEEFEAAVTEHQKRFAAASVRMTPVMDNTLMTKLMVEAKEHPDDAASQAALAAAYAAPEVRRYDAAKKYAEAALKLAKEGPAAGKANAVLGIMAFEKDKNYRQSKEHFQAAASADPDNFAARLYLGMIASKEGDWKLAVEQLEKARALYPRWIAGAHNPYDELAKAYDGMGEKDKAFGIMRELVALDKNGYEPALKLARMANSAGKPELAQWAAWQAVKIDPFKPEPHLCWGAAAARLKDWPVAEREWRLAVRADAASIEARAGLARMLAGAGRRDEAKQVVAEAKALAPEHPEVGALVKEIGLSEAAPVPRPKPEDQPAPKPEAKPVPEPEEKPAPAEEPREVPKLEKIN